MLFYKFVNINPKISIQRGVEYPCVMMNEVKPGKKNVSGVFFKPFKGGSKFKKGDTLFARITPCLENGKIAKYTGINGDYGFGSTEFFVFRAREGISDEDYVYYLSLSDIVTKPAIASMVGTSGRQRANLSVIENLDIPLPPLPTQQKIASILSVYDNLIENNTRRIQILEEMAQRIYKEWFVDFKYPGHENDKLVDSELGMIPEEWEVKKIKDLGDVITGSTPSKKVPEYYGIDIPFIKTPDMHGNIFSIETNECLSHLGAESQIKKMLPSGSLCVSCIGTAGVVCITTQPSQTNQQINSIITHKSDIREYLYFSLLGLKETINWYLNN